MIGDLVGLLQEAETVENNTRLQQLLTDLLDSTNAENVDALFRLFRHLLSTRQSLFETDTSEGQMVVKRLREKCAKHGDQELSRLIDLHLPFTTRFESIFQPPLDHSITENDPQESRKRRREDSETLEACSRRLARAITAGQLIDADLTEIELRCLPAVALSLPDHLLPILQVVRANVSKCPELIAEICENFACCARKGLQVAFETNRINYSCNCMMDNHGNGNPDRMLEKYFGETLCSLALPPHAMRQRLRAFHSIKHIIRHCDKNISLLNPRELGDLLMRSIESSSRWIRLSSIDLYHLAAKSNLLDINVHKKVVQIAKDPDRSDEVISIALATLCTINATHEVDTAASIKEEFAKQEELLELLDKAVNQGGMAAIHSTIQLSKKSPSELAAAQSPAFLIRLLNKSMFEAASKIIYRKPIHEILQSNLEAIIPSLVLAADKSGLSAICGYVETELLELIVEYADSILYEYFMNHYNQESLYNLYSVLNDLSASNENKPPVTNKRRQSKSAGDKKMSLSLLQLLKTCLQKLMVKLCFALGCPNRNEKAKHAIVKCKEILHGPPDKSAKDFRFDSVESFIMNFFLGILHDFLNNRLLSEVKPSEKEIAVQALRSLIEWIESPISKYSAQIVNFLTKAQKVVELVPSCISTWKSFAEKVKIHEPPNSLDVLMSALADVLDPANEVDILKIFEGLIMRLGENIIGKTPYLFVFIPSPEVFSELRQSSSDAIAVTSADGTNYLTSLNDRSLDIFIRALSHENFIAVSAALGYLADVLERDKSESISSFVLSETISPKFRQFINCLFSLPARFSDASVLQKSMQCIGLIGAIDPGRLGSLYTQNQRMLARSTESALILLTSDNSCSMQFVCRFIEQKLVPAFRATSNTIVQDRLAFVIQEMLKSVGFSALGDLLMSEQGCDPDMLKAWTMISKDVRETIAPFLASKYYIRLADPRGWTESIFPGCESYSVWIQKWTASLMGLLRSDDPVYQLLKPFQAILISSCDSSLAASLVPHIILYLVVQYGDSEKVLGEILSVLSGHCLNTEFANIFRGIQLPEKDLNAAQVIFQIYGMMKEWEKAQTNLAIERQIKQRKNESSTIRNQIVPVKKFISSIPSEKMAAASFQCGSYQRALFHYEQYVRSNINNATQQVSYELFENLHKIYSRVDDADGLEGVQAMLFKHGNGLTLDQQIIANYSSSRWNDAQSSLEVALQTSSGEEGSDAVYHIGLLDCLKNLGHLEMMSTHLKGVKGDDRRDRSWDQILDSYGAEAAWRLGQWETLSEIHNDAINAGNSPFEVIFGKLLYSVRQREKNLVMPLLREARRKLGPELRSVETDSYAKFYEVIVKIHMIEEVQICWNYLSNPDLHCQEGYDNLLRRLDYRLRCCSTQFKHQEPVLNLRRILLNDLSTVLQGQLSTSACNESKMIWLTSAKLARKSNHFQTAFSALLRAESEYMDSAIFIERARLFHATGRHELAFRELSHALRSKGDPNSGPIDPEVSVIISTPAISLTPGSERESNLRAKGALLLARWLQQSSFGRTVDVEAWYKEVTVVSPKWEKAWFFIGRYYNQLLDERNARFQVICESLDTIKDRNDRRNGEKEKFDCFLRIGEALAAVIKCYSRSLQYGTQNIFQSLPRLITLWLDFTVPTTEDLKEKKSGITVIRTQTISAINNYISSMIKKTPSFVFLTAYPQILSRICHENPSVAPLLNSIISNVLLDYPQQALWHLVSVLKSSDPKRARKCNEVISGCKGTASVRDLCKQAMALGDQLLHLCNFSIPENHEGPMSMTKDFSALKAITDLELIVPLQPSLTVTLPERKTTTSYTGHKPFATNLPTIKGFIDRIDIMNSLQKPRRIGVIGSDGRIYHFLCKPNDDLRKDSRVLEFYGMINKLLKRRSDSRQRNLKIRTYAVVPLNEECGLIEWVPATTTFRHIITRLYKTKGVVCSANVLREWKDLAGTNPKRAQEFFLNQLLKLHQPPVFHQWFIDSFARPDTWFSARLAWTRSAAVMSMVGFIVGLGDRHAENILIDETSGELMHVDFNCLFEKGVTFDFPEVVPFRLTHNMVDGFGVTGTEGVFFKCAELTLKTLRENKESLMSVLEAFVHDPLVEWTKRGGNSTRSSLSFKPVDAPDQGRRVLRNISNKLEGGMGLTHQLTTLMAGSANKSVNIHSSKEALMYTALGLSDNGLQDTKRLGLEAQVVELIEMATRVSLLSQMWIGWSSYY